MRIISCRACHFKELVEILDLGQQYLSDFKADRSFPPKFPLTLMLCKNCSLVQLSHTVPRDNMYHEGYGYRSGVNEQIRSNLEMLVKIGYKNVDNVKSWLDIACNDGTLLSMVSKNIYRVGVDPVKKFKAESKQHADLIIDDYFPTKDLSDQIKFDVITSISMFYDLDDPNQFISMVSKYLAPDGIWIVQQNYIISMLKNTSFDNVCHEHIGYYSLTAMKHLIDSHNLEIISVFEDDINGGSIITIISHRGTKKIDASVELFLEVEKDFGVSNPDSYKDFESNVSKISIQLFDLIKQLRKENKSIYIYGASTRGSVIWQKVGLNSELIDFAVERQQEKIGKFFSAISVPIISEYDMRKNPPDYLLIGPWFLRESFIEREKEFLQNGGKMIIPLPEIQIIGN